VGKNKNKQEKRTNPANETQTLTERRNMPQGARKPNGQSSK